MGKRKLAAVVGLGASVSSVPIPTGCSAPARWLLKSEPSDYSIAQEGALPCCTSRSRAPCFSRCPPPQLAADGETTWDGVRSAIARKHLREMAEGELCLFYHSSCKQVGVVGEAVVSKPAYPDPADPKWAVVDIKLVEDWGEIVSLDTLKQYKETSLLGLQLLRQPRLSVQPVSQEHYDFIRSLRSCSS
ncbi:MAG: hypothetical protein SGPRY_006811 [Prymnesium sp.]